MSSTADSWASIVYISSIWGVCWSDDTYRNNRNNNLIIKRLISNENVRKICKRAKTMPSFTFSLIGCVCFSHCASHCCSVCSFVSRSLSSHGCLVILLLKSSVYIFPFLKNLSFFYYAWSQYRVTTASPGLNWNELKLMYRRQHEVCFIYYHSSIEWVKNNPFNAPKWKYLKFNAKHPQLEQNVCF